MPTSSNQPLATDVKHVRNQAMECCKFLLSFLVVFNHAWFPGTLGQISNTLCTFAVPTFFMIAGYFNYQATPKQIIRRTRHIFSLFVFGTCLHLVWGCLSTELDGGSSIAYLRAAVPDPDEIIRWVVLHSHPYAGHYWYLTAMMAVYTVFYLFTVFFDKETVNYRSFYMLCLMLLTVTFAFDTVASAAGHEETDLFSRSGWFVGLPMFGIGLFIREYQERIFSAYHITTIKSILLVATGIALAILQGLTIGTGILPFGTLIGVVALMLFLVSHPVITKSPKVAKLALELGPVSTWIYLIHLMFVLVYDKLLHAPFTALLGTAEPYLFPLIVAAMSLITSILCNTLSHCFAKMGRKH